jgi:hypothetical protein
VDGEAPTRQRLTLSLEGVALSDRLRCCEDDAKALVVGSAHLAIARWRVTGPSVDPSSEYARRFWLPIIGPTCFLLAQTLTHTLRRVQDPDHISVPTVQLAESIGIGGSLGLHAPLVRSVARLVVFELAMPTNGTLLVRDEWPLLTHRQHRRLPEWLARQHRQDLARVQRADTQLVAPIQERRQA